VASIHLFDEGIELWNAPEFPVTGPYRGHDGVRQWASEQWEVFSGLHHEIEEIIEAPDGETLVSVQRTQGRTRHTDMKTDVRWATDCKGLRVLLPRRDEALAPPGTQGYGQSGKSTGRWSNARRDSAPDQRSGAVFRGRP
jgi:hypothetical protein